MKKMNAKTVADAVGGTLLCGDPETVIENISLDSRKMAGNDIFVPLIGEKTDGHRYIDSAFSNGAAATFTSEHDKADSDRPYIRVENALDALQDLGRYFRARLSFPFIAITGSVGKTSTRELVDCALEAGLKVGSTRGNSNGQLGVPITLSEMDDDCDVAVLEMGVSLPGEMARICDIARPNAAIITGIGVSHIDYLGSREGILREKLHITDHFDENSLLIINGDDDMLRPLKGKLPFRVVSYGFGPENDIVGSDIETGGGAISFTLTYGDIVKRVQLSVPGEHNVMNAMAAVAAAKEFGVDIDAAIGGIFGYVGYGRRLQLIKCRDIDIIDDSYNASPDSARAAIKVLEASDPERRRVLIFADMLELGADTPLYHREICDFAAEHGVELLITVGKYAGDGAREANTRGMEVHSFSSNDDAKAALAELIRKDDTVLVKGSNSMHLDEIVSYLKENDFEVC